MSNYPMIEQVNRLVGNLLAEGISIFLPEIGTLYTEQRATRKISKRMVEPPCRIVVFTPQKKGGSLVAHIAHVAACDDATAQDVYTRWLTNVRRNDELVMAGIGRLQGQHFRMDAAFDARLNPQGHVPIRIRRSHRMDWTLWVGICTILCVVAGVGYWWFFIQSQPAVVFSEQKVVELKQNADRPTVDTTVVAPSPAKNTPNVAQPSEPASQSKPMVSSKTEVTTPVEAAALVSGHKYVVLGVYSTFENAVRAVTQAAEAKSPLTCGIYRFGAKFLVSPFESTDPETCTLFIRAHADNYPDMWTYTAR